MVRDLFQPQNKKWLNYWRLYCRIFNIKICRKCGERLDKDYKKRNRGYICVKCQ